jgi:threo-3-hydroxy-L-aspartate ammonia-lyase
MLTVSDDDIIETMHFVWTRLKLIVEPTGVLALAALFKRRLSLEGQRAGVILSGGNVDIAAAARWFTDSWERLRLAGLPLG